MKCETTARAKLAEIVFLSEDYISRLFIKETGKSLTKYITEVRIKKAKLFIETTSYSISQIANMVGYNNFSYFSKSFKDYYNYTPNECRNKKNLS